MTCVYRDALACLRVHKCMCTFVHAHVCMYVYMSLCVRVCVRCIEEEQIKALGHMGATAGWTLPGIWVLTVNRIARAQGCHPIKINVSSAHF